MNKVISTPIILSLSLFLFLFFPSEKADAQGISVYVNGVQQHYDQPPEVVNGRTLVPFRGIFESLGVSVRWLGTTNTAVAENNDVRVEITIGSDIAKVKYKNLAWQHVKLDTPAQVLNNRTMMPLRFVSETFGAQVNWNQSTKTIHINHINKSLLESLNYEVIAVDGVLPNDYGLVVLEGVLIMELEDYSSYRTLMNLSKAGWQEVLYDFYSEHSYHILGATSGYVYVGYGGDWVVSTTMNYKTSRNQIRFTFNDDHIRSLGYE